MLSLIDVLSFHEREKKTARPNCRDWYCDLDRHATEELRLSFRNRGRARQALGHGKLETVHRQGR
jgi:hypothetical protein